MSLKKITNERVLCFVAYVQETEIDEVFKVFMNELEQSDNPEQANLTLMLESAKAKVATKAGTDLQKSIYQSVLHHCNS